MTVASGAVSSKVVLPTKPAEIDNRWVVQKTVMIGPPGIGKSAFWSYGDKTLYLQCEAGLNHLSVMKVPVRVWSDWVAVIDALFEAKKKGEFIYDTIVVDTVDKLVDYASEEAADRGRQKYKAADIHTIGDVPNGTGWAWGTGLIEGALNDLERLGVHVVLIGHLDRKEIKMPNNVSLHMQTVSIGGKTGRYIASWPDHFLNIEATFRGQEQVRKVRTIPTSTIEAKSRGGVVPDGWTWLADDKANYVKFRGLFT